MNEVAAKLLLLDFWSSACVVFIIIGILAVLYIVVLFIQYYQSVHSGAENEKDYLLFKKASDKHKTQYYHDEMDKYKSKWESDKLYQKWCAKFIGIVISFSLFCFVVGISSPSSRTRDILTGLIFVQYGETMLNTTETGEEVKKSLKALIEGWRIQLEQENKDRKETGSNEKGNYGERME